MTKSTFLSMVPKSAVYTGFGRRLSTAETSSKSPSAGSARWRPTRARIARMRATGSTMSIGTGKRAGTKRFPPRCSLSASRTLIGMVMRSAGTVAPCASW